MLTVYISLTACAFQTVLRLRHGHPQGTAKGAFTPPLEIGTKNQNFLENLESVA